MSDTFSWYNTSGALPASFEPTYKSCTQDTTKLSVEFQDLITNRGGKQQSAKFTPVASDPWTLIACTQYRLKIPVSGGAIYMYFLNIPSTNGYINIEDNVFRFYNHQILTKNSTVLSLQVMPIRATSEGYGMIFATDLDAKDTSGYPSPYLFLDQRNWGETKFTALRVTLIFYVP